MTRRFLLGVLAMGYSRAVIAAIQLVLVPVLAIRWGLPLYGQWLMLSAIPGFLGASDFGFSTTAGMRIIGEIAVGSPDQALITYRSARRMILILSTIILAVTLAAIAMVPDRLLAVRGAMGAGEARSVLIILAIFAMLALQAPLLTAIARAMGKTAQGVAIEGTIQLVEGLATIAVVSGGGRPLHVALAYVLLRLTAILGFHAYARAIAPWLRGAAGASQARIRAMWRPALAAMALPLSQAGYLQGTALAVGAAGGAALVPVYTSLRTLSRLGYQAALMVVIPLMPEYAAARARGDDRRSALIVGGSTQVVIAMAIGYALIIGLFGLPLLSLWTRGAIQPPQTMIVLTALAAAMSIVWTPLSDLLLAINRHETFAYAFVVSAAGAVGLTLLLVGLWGVTGAAAAGMTLEFTMMVTVARSLRCHGGPIELRLSAFMPMLRAAFSRISR